MTDNLTLGHLLRLEKLYRSPRPSIILCHPDVLDQVQFWAAEAGWLDDGTLVHASENIDGPDVVYWVGIKVRKDVRDEETIT